MEAPPPERQLTTKTPATYNANLFGPYWFERLGHQFTLTAVLGSQNRLSSKDYQKLDSGPIANTITQTQVTSNAPFIAILPNGR